MGETDRKNPQKLGPASPIAGQPETAANRCEVTRTYLEMSSRQQLVPGHPPTVSATLDRIDPCPVDTWRALYRQIGAPWQWHDRDAWEEDAMHAHLARTNIQIYRVAAAHGSDWTDAAGFLELERHGDGSVEIAYSRPRAANAIEAFVKQSHQGLPMRAMTSMKFA